MDTRASPIRYLDQLGVLRTQPLLAHGVQVDRADLQLLAEQRIPVAHCPRSNVLLNCGRMPIELYQEAGAPLAMGTDSLSSSPSLSLWEEAASAVQMHRAAGVELDPHDVLRICTLDGARALGFADLLGSLVPGKLAKLALGKPRQTGKNEADLVPTADEMLRLLWDGEVSVSRANRDIELT
jgi:aminodeoxyfutalosine deaminase